MAIEVIGKYDVSKKQEIEKLLTQYFIKYGCTYRLLSNDNYCIQLNEYGHIDYMDFSERGYNETVIKNVLKQIKYITVY